MATDKSIADIAARLERIEAALSFRPPHVFDPSPDDIPRGGGGWGWLGGQRYIPIPWPNPGDPVPIDISRLTRAQLQVSLESIKAQRIRLDAVENMIQQQLKQLKG
jgi:hypothetical protein